MKTSENEMILKINKNWDAIVSYMDDEIREEKYTLTSLRVQTSIF